MNSAQLWRDRSLYLDVFGKPYAALHSYDDLLKILLTFSYIVFCLGRLSQICVAAKQSAYPVLIMLRWETCLIPHLFKEEADIAMKKP